VLKLVVLGQMVHAMENGRKNWAPRVLPFKVTGTDTDRLPNAFLAHDVVTGRIAAKRQTAGIKFTHRPKIRFFAPQERLVAPIHIKLGRTDGHLGPLGCTKFHLNRHRGWEWGSKNIKKIHFLVKSRPVGATPLTDF